MQNLPDKYCPQRFEDVIGQEAAIKMLKRERDTGGYGGKVYWFAAPTGTGKGTLAWIMANDMAESNNVREVDAQDVNLDYVRDMEEEIALAITYLAHHGDILSESTGNYFDKIPKIYLLHP